MPARSTIGTKPEIRDTVCTREEYEASTSDEIETQTLASGQTWEFQIVLEDVEVESVARYVISANSELG